jgi:hypothetical protein
MVRNKHELVYVHIAPVTYIGYLQSHFYKSTSNFYDQEKKFENYGMKKLQDFFTDEKQSNVKNVFCFRMSQI